MLTISRATRLKNRRYLGCTQRVLGDFAQRGSQSSYSASDWAGGSNLYLHEKQSLNNTHFGLCMVE